MNPAELIQWYNIGYVGVLIMGLMFLVIAMLGLGEQDVDHDIDQDFDQDVDHDVDHDLDQDLDQDVDHDVDQDVDQDVDHDVDHDADHDADHDVSHDHDHDHDHETGHEADHHIEHGIFYNFLTLLGIGRCPLSIIVMSFCFLFAIIGLSSNLLLKGILPIPIVFGTISYGFSLIAGFFLTGTLARFIGRVLPTKETYVHQCTDLVGKTGKAVYDFKDDKGFIQIYDASDTLIEKPAVCFESQIKKGQQVIISRWDKAHNRFLVVAIPQDLELL
jgi:membrane protein implicated in regulation of membrane protease activity